MIRPKLLHSHLRHLQRLLPLKAWYTLYVQSDPTLLKLVPHAPAHTKKSQLGSYDPWRYNYITSNIGTPSIQIYYYNIKAKKQEHNIKMLMYLANKKGIAAFKSYKLIEVEKDIENFPWKFASFQVKSRSVI